MPSFAMLQPPPSVAGPVPPAPFADALLRPAASVDELLGLQHALAALAGPPRVDGALPLGRALGRVLARPHGPSAAGRPVLPAGLRLEPHHLGLLVASRHATATVFTRPRVGVVALTAGSGTAGVGPSAATAAVLAGAVERLGAQAFQAACTAGCPTALVRAVRMLASQCELVLIAGVVEDRHAGALQQALGAPAAADPVPLPRLQVPRLASAQLAGLGGGTLALALGSDPRAGAACCVALVAPLLRRLQGRSVLQPPLLHAALAENAGGAADGGPLLVQEAGQAGDLRFRLRRCGAGGDAALVLAAADGVAWQPPALDADPRAPVAYFPFRTALA